MFSAFWGRVLGCYFLFASCSPPPLNAGTDLVNQAALLWHRTRFLIFWAGFDVVPAYFVLSTHPRSGPGCGLGNRATQLQHRTVGSSCCFLSHPVDPLLVGGGGDLGILATPTAVAQDCMTSCFLFFDGMTSPRPPSLRLWRYF